LVSKEYFILPKKDPRFPSVFFIDLPCLLGDFGLGVYASRLLALLKKNQVQVTLAGSCLLQSSAAARLLLRNSPEQLQGFLKDFFLSRYLSRTTFSGTFIAPAPLAAPLPRRSIVVFHDLIAEHFPRYDGKYFLRKWVRNRAATCSMRADHLVAISHFTKSELINRLGVAEDAPFVLPNWVTPDFSPEVQKDEFARIQQAYQLPERYWLYLGGFDYRKNVEFLLQAYHAVSSLPGCPALVLAGKLPLDERRKPVCQTRGTIRQLGLTPAQVILPGRIEAEDLPALYRGADLFIFPSLMEGFGYTPAEAMACGCPVLVADNSALRELVPERACRFGTDSAGMRELVGKLTVAIHTRLPQAIAGVDLSEKRAWEQWKHLLRID
jgi:glycosyltransferase involved in cell wall biosynthesis